MDYIDLALVRLKLPTTFRSMVDQHYRPLIEKVVLWQAQKKEMPLVLGINGAQGTGKSTLGYILKLILEEEFDLKTARLSIDDVYYRRTERQALAETVHPLMATRGVPGTHDLSFAQEILDQLMQAGDDDNIRLPRFDKGVDDRAPHVTWPTFIGRPDVIVLEGWVVGTPPQTESELVQPVNALEAEADADGVWRAYVNQQLAGPYQAFLAALTAW